MLTLPQTSYPQIVLFGDSLIQGAVDFVDGFSFQAALQSRASFLQSANCFCSEGTFGC